MTKKSKVLPFPTVAQPNIEQVLDKFLQDQKPRLKPRTYRRYEEVVELYRHCLNSYGVQDLDQPTDVSLYQRLYDYRELEFCAVFGPDKILKNLHTFLNFFMIRKVMASEELLRAAGTVTKVNSINIVASICQKYGLRKIRVRIKCFIGGFGGYHKRKRNALMKESFHQGDV